MLASYLRRGMAAGLLAGLLAGLFAFLVGEAFVDQAIRLEEASAGSHGGEIFSRATQKVGLFFATGLFGVTVGGIFGLAYAYFRTRLTSETDWMRSLSLAAAIFAGAFLIPFVKYPANPPTVGDPATIGERTASYFAMVLLSLLAVLTAWQIAKILRERKVAAPVRHLSVGLGLVLALTVLFVGLPAAPDPGGFPAGLLWGFRLSSLGTQLVFWTGLGVIFGLLCERANRREELL
jgi:Probable cobalt transporter subunit (CbtA)